MHTLGSLGDVGLGINGSSLDVHDEETETQLMVGDFRLATGWTCRIRAIAYPNGWHRGYIVDSYGLASFFEAFGVEKPSAAERQLGVFFTPRRTAYDEIIAYKALANRLVTYLAYLGQIAINAVPEAQRVIVQQRARHGVDFDPVTAAIEEPDAATLTADGYAATGVPSVEQHRHGDSRVGGGWGYSVSSHHPGRQRRRLHRRGTRALCLLRGAQGLGSGRCRRRPWSL